MTTTHIDQAIREVLADQVDDKVLGTIDRLVTDGVAYWQPDIEQVGVAGLLVETTGKDLCVAIVYMPVPGFREHADFESGTELENLIRHY